MGLTVLGPRESGSYEVRKLVSWQFTSLQTWTAIDLIDDGTGAQRAER